MNQTNMYNHILINFRKKHVIDYGLIAEEDIGMLGERSFYQYNGTVTTWYVDSHYLINYLNIYIPVTS
jgi:hypothetical protein